MQWKHNFKHIDSSDSLKAYAEKEFEKAGRHLLKQSQWQIFYSKGKHSDCCVDVSVHDGNGHFKATAHDDSFYIAVDKACEKLERQFLKKKEILQNHKEPEQTKEGRLERLNPRLEYDNSPYPIKKPA